MKAIKSILVAAIPATIIIGCGGGSSNNTPQTNTLPAGYTCTKNNICGPIGIVNADLVTDRIKQKSRPNPNKQLNTADTDVGLGALGIVSFLFPEFAPVVAVASITSNFYNGFDGNLVQTTANLAESINQLNTQLSTLQSQVFNNQNIFYNYVTANESIEAQQAYNTVQNDINNIAGNMNNTVTMNYKYYTNSNWLTGQNDTPNNNYPNAASIAASYPAMNLLNSYTTSEIFGPALDNLSNSVTCSNSGVVTIYPYNSAAAGSCGNVNDTSDIIILYNYLQQQLKVQLSQITLGTAPNNSSLEAKSLFNQYNNSIATIFENSLVSLQTAYNIEANNNLLNYLAVTTGNANNQILPYNAIGSIIESSNGSYTCSGGCTSFYITTANPSTESSNYQMAYESTANNLTQVYVNRLNQLVLSTVPYIVSDHLKPQQLILNSELLPDSQMLSDFTTNPATISAFGQTYSVKSPQELYESTQQAIAYTTLNNKLLLPVPDGNWDQLAGGSFFYQFSGLSDYIGCANMNNCQSFFPDSSTAQYNGQYFSAYNVASDYNVSQSYPIQGMLLAYPTNILNCNNPTTESFTMIQMASQFPEVAVACNDSLSNENTYIMDAGNFDTSFYINTPPLLVNNNTQFQNSSANTTSTPNSVYLSSFGNSYNNNLGVLNNIGIMFPETTGLGSAYIWVNMSGIVQSMQGKGTVAFNMSATAITVETNGSQMGTGLFCYSKVSTIAPGVAAVAICTNYNSGNSYTLQLNIGNWTVSWTPYNVN